MRDTAVGTTKMYQQGIANYNFATTRPIDGDHKTVLPFTNIVWKKTTKAAFAYKGPYTIMVYCQGAAKVVPATAGTCYNPPIRTNYPSGELSKVWYEGPDDKTC